MSTPRILMGYRRPQLTLIPTQIYRTDTGPNQTSPTDVGIGPNISNISWSQANSVFPPPQLSIRRLGQSQLMRAPTKYLHRSRGSHGIRQVTSTSLIRRQGSSQPLPPDVAVPQISPNRRRDFLKYCQLTPGISNPAP